MKKTKIEIPVSKTPLAEQLHKTNVSLLRRYQAKVWGDDRVLKFLEYELLTFLFGSLSGGLGYFLRKKSYYRIFRKFGRGVILGKGLVIRHPSRISLGHRVAIDDYVLLDACGAGEEGIILEDNVIVSRNCVVQGKTGPVAIGNRTDIGCNTIITSGAGVYIGHSVLIAGNCYFGGGRYLSKRLDIPIMDQGLYSKGPVVIGDDVWLGAGVIVLDGVQIGEGCIVGAGAVVARDLPKYAIAVGVPATVVKTRTNNGSLPNR